jgi:TetR/AcrR family transcriptional repressor of nem operon
MAKASTRDRVIEAALSLMLAKGYPATTVDEICAEADVSKGSFYHFFSSKEELGLAALDAYSQKGFQALQAGSYVSLEDPRERLFGFLEHAQAIAEDVWGNGCLLGNMAVELADTNETMRKRISQIFEKLAGRLAEMFAVVVEDDRDDSPGALELAEFFLSALEGSIVLAKAHDDWARVPAALENFRRYVEMLAQESVTP